MPSKDRGAVGITEEFRTAYAQLCEPAVARPELSPTRLAMACTRVLPVAGASISMFTAPMIWIPVGASDGAAMIAERLQFTVAQGPCIDAHHTGQRVMATEPVIAQRWPIFHERLIMGVISVALSLSLPLADAPAILRAHAFSADRTLDDTAHDIVSGAMSPYRLTQDSNA
jgi:hypothetical protein